MDTPQLPRSRLGSLSLGVGLGAIALFCLVMAGILLLTFAGQTETFTTPVVFVVGLAVLGSLFVALVGSALAIGGLVQKGQRKTTAFVGLVLNGGLLLAIVVTMLIGMLFSEG